MNDTSVLLVDDDSDVLGAIGARCRALGWSVQTAHNLLTAMSLIERDPPDILCIDVQMPTGDGLRFCETLAADPATRHIRLVALTGQRDAETVRRCQELGAHYVPKRPDVWSELEPLLRELTAPPAQPLAARTIVIADDDADLVESLTQRCARLDCRVIGASSALEAINIIHRVTPDLVCMDVNMPAGNGLSVCEMMSSDERLRSIPVIVLTGNTDQHTIRRCHDMMVYYVEKSVTIWERVEPLLLELLGGTDKVGDDPARRQPTEATRTDRSSTCKMPPAADTHVSDDSLLDAVFELLGDGAEPLRVESAAGAEDTNRRAEDEPPWVLCIDDDPDFSEALKCRLEAYGVAVIRAFSGMEGYRLAFTNPARVILLDYNMPDGQGDYVLGRLQDNPVTKDIPVIVITGVRDKSLERKMYGLGAKRFLTKPIQFDALRDELANYMDILAEPAEVAAV